MDSIVIFVVAVSTLAVYLLPGFVAACRDHPRATAVFVLNLVLGWTVIGWIAALVWAIRTPAAERAPAPTGIDQYRRA
jgi:Superinfection immunity protein